MLKYPLHLPSSTCSRPMTEDNADLFFRCHSSIWSIDHLRPSEALNELCKLLYAKSYDERQRVGNRFRVVAGDSKRTAQTIRALFAEAVFQGLNGSEGDDSRGILEEPLMLSDAAIFGVVQLLEPYSLSGSKVDVKGAAFQQLTEAAVRSGMGQYFTPEPVVRFMVKVAEVSAADLVLDPFCGSGHFLVACADAVAASKEASDEAKHRFATRGLVGIEKDKHMVRMALTDVLLHGRTRIRVWNRDALLPISTYGDLFGVAETANRKEASLVLTNPPFGKRITEEAMASLGDFELASRGHPTPLEVLGLERAIQFLSARGRIAIVLPHSVLTNRTMQKVREYVARTCRVLAIVSLPAETFARHAGVGQASVLYLQKRAAPDAVLKDSYGVYCASCKSVGYDQTGRPHGQDELPDIATDFLQRFLHGRGELSKGIIVDIRELLRKGFGPEQHAREVTHPEAPTLPLAELCSRIFTGVSPGREGYADGGSRILKVGDLTGEGIDWQPSGERAWVDAAFAQRHSDRKLERGDILLTAAAHQRKYIGMKVDIVDEIRGGNPLALCTPEVMVLRPRSELVNPYYLLGWLRTKAGYEAIQTCVRGQTAHLYPRDLREIRVPLPPENSTKELKEIEGLYSTAQEMRDRAKGMIRQADLAVRRILDRETGNLVQPPSKTHARSKKSQRDLGSW